MRPKITAGIFITLSIISLLARILLRFRAGRGLYLDDYLVLIGTICLSAETVLFYQECNDFMLASAIQNDPALVVQIGPGWIEHQIGHSLANFVASFALVWAAIFAIKCSFLAWFRVLIERVTGIRVYYWFVVVVTVASWLVVMLEPTFLCHHPRLSLRTDISSS